MNTTLCSCMDPKPCSNLAKWRLVFKDAIIDMCQPHFRASNFTTFAKDNQPKIELISK